jgi:DNA-binding transcriptional LysR family regulator
MPAKAKALEITKQIDWNRLHTFLVVGEAGTFTRAGRKLNLSQSAVSRQISILEGELNTPLFYRTSQGLVFTEAGEDLFNTIKAISDKLAMGLARVNERREKPEGPLRITTTVAFGSAWLSSRMTEFHRIYPDISVSLILADNIELDLLHRQADCAIRFRKQTEPTLVERYLMTVQYHLYGSRTYLERRGKPAKPKDLDSHDLIVYGDDAAVPIADMNSVLTIGRPPGSSPRAAALCVNSVYGIFRAVESGLGIGALPHYVAEENPGIVQVLPEFSGPTFEVYFVYPEELRHSKRIDALKSFLIEQSRGERKRQPRRRGAESRTEEALG